MEWGRWSSERRREEKMRRREERRRKGEPIIDSSENTSSLQHPNTHNRIWAHSYYQIWACHGTSSHSSRVCKQTYTKNLWQ